MAINVAIIALAIAIGLPLSSALIDQDAQARKTYETLKIKGVPVLISKQQYIIGFSEQVWGRFLGKGDAKSPTVGTEGA